VGRFYGLVVQIAGQLLGGKHGLARLLGKFFKIHIPS
jgi:predicted transcriptional regulator